MSESLRKTGIDIIGDVPWGTHFCQFYRTPQDLLDILVPYFSEGLRNNEYCIWITSEPLEADAARAALAKGMPDLKDRERKGQIEIIPHTDSYLKGGSFDAGQVLDGWVRKLDAALAAGYEGLRLTGNTFWLEKKDWRTFTDYEAEVDSVIGRYRMLAVCTYSLDLCGTNEVLDIIANHCFALIRRGDRWKMVESAERRRTDEALRESEERFRAIASSTPDHVLVQDRDLRYTLVVNPQIGLTEQDMLGKTDSEILAKEDAEKLTRIKRRVLETGEPVHVESPVVSRSGAMEYFEGSYVPRRDAQGRVDGLIGYFRNMTERKRAEAALRESENQFRVLTENLQSAVALVDDRGRFSIVNRAFLQMFDLADEALIKNVNDRDWSQWQVFDEQGVLLDADEHPVRKAAITGRPVKDKLVAVKSPARQDLRWMLVSAEPVFDDKGGVRRLICTYHDVTERKQAEEALRDAKNELEMKVEERTAELRQANEQLQKENQERMETERLLRLEEARLDALFCMSQMSEAPLNKITGFILEHTIALTRSKIGFVGFLSEDESVYTLHAVSKDVVKECNVTGDPVQWHVVDAGIWADAIREHRTLFVNDYSQPHPRKKGLPLGHPYVERFMVVPILDGERIVALAGVGNKASDYDKSDERQLVLLLSGMWSCVQKNRSREELQNAYNELELKVEQRTASLRESEESLKRAQEIAHLGSWELDLVNDRLTWSDEAYRIFGLTPGEFGSTYKAFLDVIHPDDRAAVDAAYSASLAEGRDGYEIEHRIVRRDTEEVRIVYEKCEHQRDASGRIVRSVGMVHDVTEARKAAALALALAEQERLRLGAAVEQASDSVVMVDLDGKIQYVNAAFESINKTPRDKAVRGSYFDLLAGDAPAAAIRESISSGKAWHGQLARAVAVGRPVELEVAISPTHNPSGKVIGGLVTEKDVTRENALQRQVRQSQKMEALGTLAGGITHDFNNILSTIFINTELALLDLDPTNPAGRSLPLVLQAANRGKELVKQIITFSRQREWERKPLEITAIVKEGMKFLRSTLSKDIAIHESISADCGSILADPSQVHQVLVNLCQNAALAVSERAGHLEVKLEPVEVDSDMAARHPDLKPRTYVRLTVADNGCGMPPEVMERIFEPFFTTRKHGEGSGLGLSVVHGIVKSYDGAITVYSEPGKGSVFSVYIPRLPGEVEPGEKGEKTRPERGREHILLVEDEEVQLKSVARLLERLGYRVTAKPSGRTALTAFKKNPGAFDLVITDQAMPRMTGVELAKTLVGVRPDIPIILCTGFSEKVNGETVGQSGIRAFVMKPFTIQEISKRIRAALKK
jgi:PAS domain S-box-containing protein